MPIRWKPYGGLGAGGPRGTGPGTGGEGAGTGGRGVVRCEGANGGGKRVVGQIVGRSLLDDGQSRGEVEWGGGSPLQFYNRMQYNTKLFQKKSPDINIALNDMWCQNAS